MNKIEFKTKLQEYYSDSELNFLYKYIERETRFDNANDIINRLSKHEPIDYILGYTYFYRQKLKVSSSVLIPRPETEELVELIINENKDKKNLKILDIGTGSGCIALSLVKHLNCEKVMGVDISEPALSIAAENTNALNLKVDFKQVDILDDTSLLSENKWDIIVSNPPYINIDEKESLGMNLEFEPEIALYTENDPLIFYEKILERSKSILAEAGLLYFETHQDYQIGNVESFERKSYRDMSGHERFLRYQVLS